MIKNFIKYGIGYTDYLKGDYINLTEEQKKQYDDVMETDLYGVIVDNTPILYLGVNTNYYKEDLSTC